jgi:hypothetical protein
MLKRSGPGARAIAQPARSDDLADQAPNTAPAHAAQVGGRSPKAKGARFEREVVQLLQALGIAAERVPLSGAVKTSRRFNHDVSCPIRGIDQRIEAKRRARAFITIDKMLGGNFALIVRDDRSRPLVVMTLETFAELAR